MKDNIMKNYGRLDITLEKGIGSKVFDTEGKEYIDFVSGIAVNCLGHSHPAILKAINEQSEKLIHISNLYWNEPQLKLAKKLVDNSDHKEAFFCNSGTEAVETALKIARKFGKNKKGKNKNEILYMENSFHGRSLGALAVTGQKKYQTPFMPLMEGVNSVKFNDIDDLKSKINGNTCGVIIEPIQGEGGIEKVDKEFLKKLRVLCNEYNALLIFDEVQCGIGRLGKLFAYESLEVIPDVICMAKGLGGGFPIGAVLTNKKASVLKKGDHGCTFGGNPLASQVSLAVLKELIDGRVIKKVKDKENYIVGKLKKLKDKYEVIKEIKGEGLLLGIKLNDKPQKLLNKTLDNGLLLVGAGKNVIRIVPPLNVKKEDIDKGLDILEKSIKVIY
ncbi:MAG: aspartate aminotransferase family protein [Firmicutes bacterium]|nr:aspartate aminotransferase family protein [Bacillota bacterium]